LHIPACYTTQLHYSYAIYTSFDSVIGEPELQEPTHSQTKGFTITPKDADILSSYLDEFEHVDTQMRPQFWKRQWEKYTTIALVILDLIKRMQSRSV
jgi:hypothetical protein